MKYKVQQNNRFNYSSQSYAEQVQTIHTENKKDEITVRLITEEDTFAAMEDDWQNLVNEAEVSIYSSFDWLFCWWKHFGRHPKRELNIFTIYNDEKLIGIVPLYLGISQIGPFTIQRRLHLMGCGTKKSEFFSYIKDYGYSDFLDVIVHSDYKLSAARIISDIFMKDSIKADLICLQHVNEDSFIMQHLIPVLDQKNITNRREKTDLCPQINLPSTMKEFIKQTGPSSRRRKLRKTLKAVGKKYSVKEALSVKDVQEGVRKLVFLHQNRWNSIGFPGAFYDKRHLHFVEEISTILFKKGSIWFKFAFDKNGISAARLAINDGKRFYDWLSGFDDSAPSANSRPGLGLLANMIEDAIDARASKVELMRGVERYKFDFTDETIQNWRVTIPLYGKKELFISTRNKLLTISAKMYAGISRELELLKVQYLQSGLLKMFISYSSFRYRSLFKKG